MTGDERQTQLSRIFATTIQDDDSARRAIAALPGDFASALFAEAAASDDVTGLESARAYLDLRLAYFAGLIEPATERAVRAAFEERLVAWSAPIPNPNSKN
jgi:hypothetical protein